MKAWEPGSQCRFQSRSEGPEPETPRSRLTAQRNSQTETMNPPFLHSLLYPGLNRVIDVLPRCGGQSVLPHTCGYAQSCLTLCVSLDCSPPGCSVHGVFQARILDWVAISFSRGSNLHLLHWQVDSLPWSHQGSSYKECMLSNFSRVQFFETPWTITHQAPLSVGFFRQKYWSG